MGKRKKRRECGVCGMPARKRARVIWLKHDGGASPAMACKACRARALTIVIVASPKAQAFGSLGPAMPVEVGEALVRSLDEVAMCPHGRAMREACEACGRSTRKLEAEATVGVLERMRVAGEELKKRAAGARRRRKAGES